MININSNMPTMYEGIISDVLDTMPQNARRVAKRELMLMDDRCKYETRNLLNRYLYSGMPMSINELHNIYSGRIPLVIKFFHEELWPYKTKSTA